MALVAVMLALLLVTAIAAGIIILTNTETNTSSNFKDEQRAFFAAKAGIEEARDRLRTRKFDTPLRVLPTLVGRQFNRCPVHYESAERRDGGAVDQHQQVCGRRNLQ